MIPVNPSKVLEEVPKTAHLTWTNVGIGLLFLLLDAALSVFLELGLSMSLITAALRCVVQLSVMVSFSDPVQNFHEFSGLTVGPPVISKPSGACFAKGL
jgi:hypothetical protein